MSSDPYFLLTNREAKSLIEKNRVESIEEQLKLLHDKEPDSSKHMYISTEFNYHFNREIRKKEEAFSKDPEYHRLFQHVTPEEFNSMELNIHANFTQSAFGSFRKVSRYEPLYGINKILYSTAFQNSMFYDHPRQPIDFHTVEMFVGLIFLSFVYAPDHFCESSIEGIVFRLEQDIKDNKYGLYSPSEDYKGCVDISTMHFCLEHFHVSEDNLHEIMCVFRECVLSSGSFLSCDSFTPAPQKISADALGLFYKAVPSDLYFYNISIRLPSNLPFIVDFFPRPEQTTQAEKIPKHYPVDVWIRIYNDFASARHTPVLIFSAEFCSFETIRLLRQHRIPAICLFSPGVVKQITCDTFKEANLSGKSESKISPGDSLINTTTEEVITSSGIMKGNKMATSYYWSNAFSFNNRKTNSQKIHLDELQKLYKEHSDLCRKTNKSMSYVNTIMEDKHSGQSSLTSVFFSLLAGNLFTLHSALKSRNDEYSRDRDFLLFVGHSLIKRSADKKRERLPRRTAAS